MHYRTLGKTGLSVSEVGYGAWGIGQSGWVGARDDESLNALHRAIDLGVNFIDTALAYGDGHSEQLVGQVEQIDHDVGDLKADGVQGLRIGRDLGTPLKMFHQFG